jgi:hypothetical protein
LYESCANCQRTDFKTTPAGIKRKIDLQCFHPKTGLNKHLKREDHALLPRVKIKTYTTATEGVQQPQLTIMHKATRQQVSIIWKYKQPINESATT